MRSSNLNVLSSSHSGQTARTLQWCSCGQFLTDVVDGAVVAAEDEQRAGRVVAADGDDVLVLNRFNPVNPRQTEHELNICRASDLPVFGDGVPHSHFPRVTGGNQLITDEEERLHRNV